MTKAEALSDIFWGYKNLDCGSVELAPSMVFPKKYSPPENHSYTVLFHDFDSDDTNSGVTREIQSPLQQNTRIGLKEYGTFRYIQTIDKTRYRWCHRLDKDFGDFKIW